MESIGFTHKIYIDFSGDDGDPRIMPGASKVICAAWIMIAPEEISYNLDILREVKKIVGCRQDCELKYVSLKNHPRKRDSLRLLSQTKAKIVIVPVLKEYIKIEGTRDPKTKSLIWFLHFFPLGPMLGDIINNEMDDIIYPQLIFDELKWKDCETHIKTTFNRVPPPLSQDNWILFDSFNKHPLLQLADIFSGLGAEFMESLQDKDLPPCRVCSMAGKRSCKYTRYHQLVGKASLMKTAYPLLLKDKNGRAYYKGFIICPPEIAKNYLFVDCLFAA